MAPLHCTLLLVALVATAAAGANIAKAVWLDQYPDARSLDGSPALYYIRPAAAGSVNATKWVIHVQGGGWCYSLDTCWQRSKTRLGSSDRQYGNNDTVDLADIQGCENNRWCGALMVNDPVMNPYAHDWNAVLLMYTDGASWTGNVADPLDYKGDKLYFRGWHNLNAVITDLIANHNLGSATDVLFGGDSAGGLATFLHADHLASRLQAAGSHAQMMAMPDSGYWPDDGVEFGPMFRAMFTMQNGTAGLLPKCVAANPQNITRCLFPEYFAPLIETTLWPLQSLYDPTQKGSNPQQHGDWMLASMRETILSDPRNGAWIHSCERHCGAELLTIDGVKVPQAIQEFRASPSSQRLWLQHQSYPCASCCNDS